MRRVMSSNSLAWFQWLIGTIVDSGPAGGRIGTVSCGGGSGLNVMVVDRPAGYGQRIQTLLVSCTLAVDSGAKPILLSATMKKALILVGKRVGKAV
jgi:hypothetical protein